MLPVWAAKEGDLVARTLWQGALLGFSSLYQARKQQIAVHNAAALMSC
jgi:hypothetical protein